MTDQAIRDIDALRGKRILVTGAGGYIGGALHRRLAQAGLSVIGTTLDQAQAELLRREGYEAEPLDLRDPSNWERLLEGVDVVVAAAAMFQEYEAAAEDYDKVNNQAALELAKTANRVGVSRFVHVSTVGVHGNVKQIPCTEQSPYNPMDLYHRTKLAGELSILEFARSLPSDGMVLTANRPAMVYGPGDNRMSMRLCRMLDRGRFFMVGSGKVLAHLGYIDDQVDSLIRSAVAPREAVHAEAFNIASDRPCELNEMMTILAEELGVKPKWPRIPVTPILAVATLCELVCKPFGISPPLHRRRVGFFTHNRAFDLTKAKQKMGFEPAWTLREGLRMTAKAYRASQPHQPPSAPQGGRGLASEPAA